MTARLAILCPGQGAQNAAMFDLPCSQPGALGRVEGWLAGAGGPVAHMPLAALLAHPSAMFDNRCAQPLVVAASLAAWSALAPRLPRPSLVAGYSVGEISAYAVAGVFALDGAVALAAQRADIMSETARTTGDQGMLAIGGIAPAMLADMAARAGCEVAIRLPAGAVIGGLAANLATFEALARQAGASVTQLPINIASHTGCLRDAVGPLRDLFGAQAGAPSLPLLAGILGDLVHDAGQAADLLARQAAEPIAWADCLDAMAELRIDVALELGPGSALTRMLRERHPRIACRSLADFRSLDGVVAWVAAQD
jgi:[acyl-carrier-protein] S-malonyltransferase